MFHRRLILKIAVFLAFGRSLPMSQSMNLENNHQRKDLQNVPHASDESVLPGKMFSALTDLSIKWRSIYHGRLYAKLLDS